MIRRVADGLVPSVDSLTVNCRQDQRSAIRQAMSGLPMEVQFAIDDRPDAGPLAGIQRGFHDITAQVACVVACDMPFVDANVLDYLFTRSTSADAAVPRIDSWYQPLHAVYRTEAMLAAMESIDTSHTRIVEVFENLDVVPVTEAELEEAGSMRTLENVNTIEEFQQAQGQFE